MTVQLYKADAYQRQCAARVLDVDARAGIILDQTVFYAAAGGQPGDAGALELDTGGVCPIATTLYAPDKSTIYHLAHADSPLPTPGQSVRASLDWGARHKLMRMHTC